MSGLNNDVVIEKLKNVNRTLRRLDKNQTDLFKVVTDSNERIVGLILQYQKDQSVANRQHEIQVLETIQRLATRDWVKRVDKRSQKNTLDIVNQKNHIHDMDGELLWLRWAVRLIIPIILVIVLTVSVAIGRQLELDIWSFFKRTSSVYASTK